MSRARRKPDPPPDVTLDADAARARLAAIIDSSDDAIVSKTLDGIITSWNAAAQRLFGYTAEEAVGRSITMIIPHERLAEEDEVLRRVRRGDRMDHFETVRIRKDGSEVHISLTVSPIRDRTGRIIGASKIARDITERRNAEAEREMLLHREVVARGEAEKANRVKDEFLATLSHELRTPLTAMLGWIRMLRTRTTDPSTAERALDTIERNTKLLTQLVEDVLDVSRITMGTMRFDAQSVALIPIIEAAVESMRPAARAKAIQLGLFLDPDVPPIAGEPARLQQIVWNLVSNAIKFTPRGGRVEIHLTQVTSRVEVRVVDTGIGIAPQFLPFVFERFTQADGSTTRRHGGLGLGLAIVRHLVELHGGTVSVDSEGPGKGATFVVALPVPAVSVPGTRAASPMHGTRLHGVRVLVVDDDADARELVGAALGSEGARITTAASVDEALAALARERPDAVVCDVAMPERDGYEFVRLLRARGDSIPVAALTAHARETERNRAAAAGFQLHIVKPVDPDELVGQIARLVGR
jgi:PAS domain S-box-containing protein